MPEGKNLSGQLAAEVKTMTPNQVAVYREKLEKELPKFLADKAQEVKAGKLSQNVRTND